MGTPLRSDMVFFSARDATVPVLLVELKARSRFDDDLRREFAAYLYGQAQPIGCQYFMLVDLDRITIYRADRADWSQPICELKSDEVFRCYDPEYPRRAVLHEYMERLVETWINDVAFHWNSSTPPAEATLRQIGLAQAVSGHSAASVV